MKNRGMNNHHPNNGTMNQQLVNREEHEPAIYYNQDPNRFVPEEQQQEYEQADENQPVDEYLRSGENDEEGANNIGEGEEDN